MHTINLTEQVINKTAAAIFNTLIKSINLGKSFSSSTAATAAILDCVVFTSLFIEDKIDPATLSVLFVVAVVVGSATRGDGAAGSGVGMGGGKSATGVEPLPSLPSSQEGCSSAMINFRYLVVAGYGKILILVGDRFGGLPID